MGYFKDFKTLQYDLTMYYDTTSQVIAIPDLTTRMTVKFDEQTLNEMTDMHIIEGGDSPEVVSYKLYGTPQHHWSILYMNNITNLHSEWPLSDEAIQAFAEKKYTDINDIHHYEKVPEMIPMDLDFLAEHYGQDAIAEITNIGHEEQLNQLKRFIKVIKPTYIRFFSDAFLAGLK